MPGGPAQAGPHTQGSNIVAMQLASQQLLQEAQYSSSFTAYDSQPASARLPDFTQVRQTPPRLAARARSRLVLQAAAWMLSALSHRDIHPGVRRRLCECER